MTEETSAQGNQPTLYSCEDCDWSGLADDLDSIADVHERVAMGEFMAAGCCPSCGSLISVADDDVPSYTLASADKLMAKRGTGKAVWLAKLLADLLRNSALDDAGEVVLKPTQLAIRSASAAVDEFRRFAST